MAAGVVADGGLLVVGERVEVREDALDGGVRQLGSLERGVRVRHVRAVVEVVVDPHRLRVDVRLERVVGVRKIGHSKAILSLLSAALCRVRRICSALVSTLAYRFEEISPRPLRPETLELDGISRAAVEAHYKLYEGYVAKRNEILGKLDGVDLSAANQVYSELRALKVDLTFAIGGIKNHELYFGHLGGGGGEPDGAFGKLVKRDFGSVDAWRADLKATGIAGRGWAWTAYDWDEGRLFNYIGDAQNTFPVWNATPLVALDVYEHAYFLDYQTDRASYIEAFFANLDWDVVNGWVEQYGIPS